MNNLLKGFSLPVKWQSWDLNLVSLTLKPMLLFIHSSCSSLGDSATQCSKINEDSNIPGTKGDVETVSLW